MCSRCWRLSPWGHTSASPASAPRVHPQVSGPQHALSSQNCRPGPAPMECARKRAQYDSIYKNTSAARDIRQYQQIVVNLACNLFVYCNPWFRLLSISLLYGIVPDCKPTPVQGLLIVDGQTKKVPSELWRPTTLSNRLHSFTREAL